MSGTGRRVPRGPLPQQTSWCGRRGSNPHVLRHWNLNPARLPVPPRPRAPTSGASPAAGSAPYSMGRPARSKNLPLWRGSRHAAMERTRREPQPRSHAAIPPRAADRFARRLAVAPEPPRHRRRLRAGAGRGAGPGAEPAPAAGRRLRRNRNRPPCRRPPAGLGSGRSPRPKRRSGASTVRPCRPSSGSSSASRCG